MTEQHAPTGRLSLRELTTEIRRLNTEKGWRDDSNTLGDYVALLHSEGGEALEAFRDHRLADATKTAFVHNGVPVLGKPEGVGSELADVVIRLLDMADVFKMHVWDMDMELADVSPVDRVRGIHINQLVTFADHVAWLHRAIDDVWDTRDCAVLLRAVVTVAGKFGVDLTFEVDRKMAFNWTRPFQHGGRTLSDPQPA